MKKPSHSRTMSSAAASVIPRPGADQISALRASLDPHQPDSFADFGQEALTALAAAGAPLAAAGSGTSDATTREPLDQAVATLSALDPQSLVPRRGLGGLFDSRGGRLKRIRQSFQASDRRMAELADQLKSQASALSDRASRLDPAQEALRRPIIDLGAWIEAGRQRLADVDTTAPDDEISAHDRLSRRLETLAGARVAALAQLPLARQLQNADAAAVASLSGAADAIGAWRDDWRKALGLDGKRPRRVQPEPADLARLSGRLNQALGRAGRALGDGAARRRQAAERLAVLNPPPGPAAE